MQETESEPRVVQKAASLYPDDWALAKQAAREVGSRSFSAGIRAIFAEYRRLKKQAESHSSIIQGG